MRARENKFQISQNEIFRMKIYSFYLCLHNSCEIWILIGKISAQPHTSLCMQNKLLMHALYCFLRQWIYTLIISTYFSNKNGFSCVFLFFSLRAPFFPLSFPFLLFSSTFLIPRPFPVFLLLFFLLIYPQSDSNSHSSSYLWFSCPSATPLHHGDLLTFPHHKLFFILT